LWLDNIRVVADGSQLFASDFEDGLQPEGLSFAVEAPAGDYAALRRFPLQDDACYYNRSYCWTFYDPGLIENDIPIIPYGPPFVHNLVESPLLLVDDAGQPLELGPSDRVLFEARAYVYMPLGAVVFWRWETAAQVAGNECMGRWEDDNFVYYGTDGKWLDLRYDITDALRLSAVDQWDAIEGVKLRLGVIDMCEHWCDIPPSAFHSDVIGPYFDDVRVIVAGASPAIWDYKAWLAFQDNFPDLAGKVRIDPAIDVAHWNNPDIVIGDSTVVELDLDLAGGIATSWNSDAGEYRPELHLWWRVLAGPHEGSNDPAMADPDASDGIWSPWTGTQDFDGETWNTMQADSAAVGGVVTDEDLFAFDLADDFFEPGDIVEYFFRAEAAGGGFHTEPNYAMSADPALRKYHILRCLPTPGATLLFVEDDEGMLPPWSEAFHFSGYCEPYDVYTTRRPSAGQNNGLAGRAEMGQLAQYEAVVWDSGRLWNYTICSGSNIECKARDDLLLTDWLTNTEHAVSLWVLGDRIANNLRNDEPFLGQVLGAELLLGGEYYDDWTGIYSPRVYASHPDLEWQGGTPDFWVYGSCPWQRRFSAITLADGLVEISHDWEEDGVASLVAGILNRDPDGDGTELNAAGYQNRVLFNPFSYSHVRDTGYGNPTGRMYIRVMVGHVLGLLLGYPPPCTEPIAVEPVAPLVTRLTGAWPNPFNPSTTIRFALTRREHTSLRIYDVAGREVRTLWDEPLGPGEHEIVWDGKGNAGRSQASGIYFLRFRAGETSRELKLVLLK